MIKGIGVSSGIAYEKALIYLNNEVVIPQYCVEDCDSEAKLALDAIESVKDRIKSLKEEASKRLSEAESEIFTAHLMMLEDEDSLINPICDLIREKKMNAAKAISSRFDEVIHMMKEIDDEYLRARAMDYEDLKEQILRTVLDIPKTDITRLEEPVVLVTEDLMPSDTICMDINNIKGIICSGGSLTSHTAVIAKAMGIPAVLACENILEEVENNEYVLMDGETGEVYCSPSEQVVEKYKNKALALEQEKKCAELFRGKQSVTKDGLVVALYANIATPSECDIAVKNDCEGIGLFRSEFLFMNRNSMPDESEQYEAYRTVLKALGEKEVIIRTLDAGGDKKISYLGVPDEMNPFLGYRAIRICLQRTDIFKTQLRALLRAGLYGNLKIMFPMISSIEELRAAKSIVREVEEELRAEGVPFKENVPLGIMVEIPAVAVAADLFAKEADFFSIGTNDLVQYALAVDRVNNKVTKLYTHYHPAVIRMIANTISAAHENGIHCGMCGEAAGDIGFLPVLIGLGLDEFSMASQNIIYMRRAISNLSHEECKVLAEKSMKARTIEEVRMILEGK